AARIWWQLSDCYSWPPWPPFPCKAPAEVEGDSSFATSSAYIKPYSGPFLPNEARRATSCCCLSLNQPK
ncbi:mCG140907, partial [Mus musculus]